MNFLARGRLIVSSHSVATFPRELLSASFISRSLIVQKTTLRHSPSCPARDQGISDRLKSTKGSVFMMPALSFWISRKRPSTGLLGTLESPSSLTKSSLDGLSTMPWRDGSRCSSGTKISTTVRPGNSLLRRVTTVQHASAKATAAVDSDSDSALVCFGGFSVTPAMPVTIWQLRRAYTLRLSARSPELSDSAEMEESDSPFASSTCLASSAPSGSSADGVTVAKTPMSYHASS
mmetsp:Transcript_19822/g.74952  ORF Transcript_19822/g.74952 Transcript_19822/m.74952 type:complete len:234 (+) Transcript_19822:1370-2071(+)